jgi:hypothetical protein
LEAERFSQRLKQLLQPFAKRIDVKLGVKLVRAVDLSAYRFLEIIDATKVCERDKILDQSTIELATKTGASRLVRQEDGRVLVGILNQYRYWTPSRARLLAADVLRDYFLAFEGVQ